MNPFKVDEKVRFKQKCRGWCYGKVFGAMGKKVYIEHEDIDSRETRKNVTVCDYNDVVFVSDESYDKVDVKIPPKAVKKVKTKVDNVNKTDLNTDVKNDVKNDVKKVDKSVKINWVTGDNSPKYYMFYKGILHGCNNIMVVDESKDMVIECCGSDTLRKKEFTCCLISGELYRYDSFYDVLNPVRNEEFNQIKKILFEAYGIKAKDVSYENDEKHFGKGSPKFTDDQRREMLSMRLARKPASEIAEKFNCSRSTVYKSTPEFKHEDVVRGYRNIDTLSTEEKASIKDAKLRGKSVKIISELFDCSPYGINKILKDCDDGNLHHE